MNKFKSMCRSFSRIVCTDFCHLYNSQSAETLTHVSVQAGLKETSQPVMAGTGSALKTVTGRPINHVYRNVNATPTTPDLIDSVSRNISVSEHT